MEQANVPQSISNRLATQQESYWPTLLLSSWRSCAPNAIEGDEAAQRQLLHALASGSGLYPW